VIVDALDLARWQFGITTVYHFLFVPLTIGLSLLVAGMQTAWVRTGKDAYLRATKFWGKLFLINFAMGVVTGIVLEFQFGMNWSEYSRFVGDIFGAPLAMEALIAFFLESTFLGLWIFGWDRLPKRVHLATIWAAAVGTLISAYFILAANSWMQHPVGYRVEPGFNPLDPVGRAELADIVAVLTNPVQLVTFPHVVSAAFLTAGAFIVGISAWHLAHGRHEEVMRPSLKLGAWVLLIAGLGTVISGDQHARVMTEMQPMKMAAAEAIWETQKHAGFSLLTIGTLDGREEVFSIRIPGLASYLATGSFDGTIEGINDIQARLERQFGPTDYRPNIPVVYWSFRLMMGFGALAAAYAALALWATRGGRRPTWSWFAPAGIAAITFPLLGNTFGWIFREMGRQPWVVHGLQLTANGVSLAVSATEVLVSMIVLTLLYGALAAVEVGLLVRFAKAGPPEITTAEADLAYEQRSGERPLTFAY
jgi:cytochrome d ubiquinol oxidase subunit I